MIREKLDYQYSETQVFCGIMTRNNFYSDSIINITIGNHKIQLEFAFQIISVFVSKS